MIRLEAQLSQKEHSPAIISAPNVGKSKLGACAIREISARCLLVLKDHCRQLPAASVLIDRCLTRKTACAYPESVYLLIRRTSVYHAFLACAYYSESLDRGADKIVVALINACYLFGIKLGVKAYLGDVLYLNVFNYIPFCEKLYSVSLGVSLCLVDIISVLKLFKICIAVNGQALDLKILRKGTVRAEICSYVLVIILLIAVFIEIVGHEGIAICALCHGYLGLIDSPAYVGDVFINNYRLTYDVVVIGKIDSTACCFYLLKSASDSGAIVGLALLSYRRNVIGGIVGGAVLGNVRFLTCPVVGVKGLALPVCRRGIVGALAAEKHSRAYKY